jgi:hypothetical protein
LRVWGQRRPRFPRGSRKVDRGTFIACRSTVIEGGERNPKTHRSSAWTANREELVGGH